MVVLRGLGFDLGFGIFWLGVFLIRRLLVVQKMTNDDVVRGVSS